MTTLTPAQQARQKARRPGGEYDTMHLAGESSGIEIGGNRPAVTQTRLANGRPATLTFTTGNTQATIRYDTPPSLEHPHGTTFAVTIDGATYETPTLDTALIAHSRTPHWDTRRVTEYRKIHNESILLDTWSAKARSIEQASWTTGARGQTKEYRDAITTPALTLRNILDREEIWLHHCGRPSTPEERADYTDLLDACGFPEDKDPECDPTDDYWAVFTDMKYPDARQQIKDTRA